MLSSTSFVTAVHGKSYFNLPIDKQPTNKFLKKKDDDKSLAEKVLDKVFSEYMPKKQENQSDMNKE